jgi:hypothetical protein
MAPRVRSRRAHLLVVPLCLTAAFIAAPSAGAVSSAACSARANDTPKKLVECIQTNDLWSHMQAFQAIADANPSPADGHPSRNSGEPGYKASVDYVAKLMKQAGYDVTIQPYKFTYYAYINKPSMTQTAPAAHDYVLSTDWNPGASAGTASAIVQPVGGIVLPPTPSPSSASGCSMTDFNAFVPGRIALIQRGGCNFGVKVLNAQSAHASGVIIFNEGNPDRTGPLSGSMLDSQNNPFIANIPVAFVPFDIGQRLYNEYAHPAAGAAAPHVDLLIEALVKPNADDYNVIAESKGGDPNHVVVVDAHLDAIYGAGMLDNASGSATILDIAQQMRKVNPRNKLRFIWFGGEELGLLGSEYYVNNLSESELSRIRYDLDADVTATPNYLIGILDPAAPDLFGRQVTSTFPDQVYEPSKVSRDQSVDYFNSIGLNHEFLSPVGTDAWWFNTAGIPASGLLTGQDCCKSEEEVNLFGGTVGNFEGNIPSFDGGCVDNPFRWCDNLSNNDPTVLTFMSQAFGNTVARMAFDTSVVWSGETPPRHKPKNYTGDGKHSLARK